VFLIQAIVMKNRVKVKLFKTQDQYLLDNNFSVKERYDGVI
jgi:hypothetical protein